MRLVSFAFISSTLFISSVRSDWISTFNDFATLQYWYGDDNSGSPFNPLRWLGGNGQWFPGPDIHHLGTAPPSGCSVDQAIYVLRHGSRYPDPSAYSGWITLYEKIQDSTFTATGPLAFLKDWKPVVQDPALQMSSESITGYREAYDLAIDLRTKYPSFFTPGAPFHVFANDYPRVIETAQNFLRAYLGVNASSHGLGTVYAVNSTGGVGALGNSLAPSDLCPNYHDTSGINETNIWDAIYEPPIVRRLQRYITSGSLNITAADTATMQYLCGFETSITGTPSPFCSVFTQEEFRDYEYHQDLRYYYGNGPGSDTGKYMMFPFLISITDLLSAYNVTSSSSNIQPLTMAFLNDGQISQLVSQIGVFDSEPALPSTHAPSSRTYIASHFVNMRGTITFERLECPSQHPSPSSSYNNTSSSSAKYIRLRLNDAVYPLPHCNSGPGSSCPLTQYTQYVAYKYHDELGSRGGFVGVCGVNTTVRDGDVRTNFWTEYERLGFVRAVSA